MRDARRRARRTALAVWGGAALVSFASRASAQVVLDGTLGPSGARVGPNYIVPQNVGRVRGANLFHSFSQFNVNSGESVTFTASDADIANVIARVTGPGASNVDGLLRSAVPGANLFLINPNAIVFGPGAQIDVQGSFVATTASYVRLSDARGFRPSPRATPF